jgi:hypothetical protein
MLKLCALAWAGEHVSGYRWPPPLVTQLRDTPLTLHRNAPKGALV